MTSDTVVQIMRQALMATFWLSAPLLAIGFVAGIVVSLVQITTSMQDTAFSTIPRLAAFLVGLILLLPWMLSRIPVLHDWTLREPGALCPLMWHFRRARWWSSCSCWHVVAGAFVFVPWPGVRGVPEPVRAMFVLGFTLALRPCWPAIGSPELTPGSLAAGAVMEAGVGMAIGVPVAILLESFTLAAQILGLQAGYAYSSTIDPNTEADSGVLLVFAQLMAGLLFFALGLDRQMLRLFAESLEKVPLGAYRAGLPAAEVLIRLGSRLFVLGVRLALPVVALMLLIDVALALLGRLNQQLQLLSLAFPAKMLAALAVLTWTMAAFPRLLGEFGEQSWLAARRMLGM